MSTKYKAASATERYKSQRQRINEHIKLLQKALLEMDKAQKKEPGNWGFVGSAEHIHGELAGITNFIDYTTL